MITPQAFSGLSEQRILIAGVVRNCEKTLRNDILRLLESLKRCKALSWLVVESDSSDKTLNALRALEVEVPEFRFISLGSLCQTMPIRTQRIAHCRNAYLKQLRSNKLYSNVDCVVVADLDGVNNLVTADGFASCWMRSKWDVCTANQRGPYYDIWALRHPIWSPNDCLQQYDFLLAHRVPKEAARWAAILTKMIKIGEMEDWIEVDSAFGGLAVYRRHVLDGVSYFGLDEAGGAVCEHVSLNHQIRSNGYRIFINPGLINAADTDHARQRTFAQCLVRRYFGLRHEVKMRFLGAVPAIGK
jgi:glycosyltransferase involved in cell wall biosynthesis